MARADAYPHAKFDSSNCLATVLESYRQAGQTGQDRQTDRQTTVW